MKDNESDGAFPGIFFKYEYLNIIFFFFLLLLFIYFYFFFGGGGVL